jgi:thiol-disulfide isomerase/thioredoxin
MTALIHDPNQATIDNALAVFKNAQVELLKLDYRKLFVAKEVGEALLPLLNVPDLDSNRAITGLLHRAGYKVSARTVDNYIFVATYWNDIVKAVGDKLEQIGYKKAIQMVREQAKLLTYVPTDDGWKEEHGGFNRAYPSGRYYAIHPKTIDGTPCWVLMGDDIPEQEWIDAEPFNGPMLFFPTLAEAKAKADELERLDRHSEPTELSEGPAKVIRHPVALEAVIEGPDNTEPEEEEDGAWLEWEYDAKSRTHTATDSSSKNSPILYRIKQRRGDVEGKPYWLIQEAGEVSLGYFKDIADAYAEAFRHSWQMPGWNLYWHPKVDYANIRADHKVSFFPTLDEAKAFAEKEHGDKITWAWEEGDDRLAPLEDVPGNFTIYAENPEESDDDAEEDEERPDSPVVTLTKDNADDILKDGPVLINFWTKGCAPSRTLEPIIEALAEELPLVTFATAEIDADACMELADKFSVGRVRTLVLIHDGKEIARRAGSDITQEELQDWLNDNLSAAEALAQETADPQVDPLDQKAALEPTTKPTEFGQAILDTICAHVETAPHRGQTGGHGHISWSIGKASDVVAHVATQLHKPLKSVAGGLSDLIEKGYLRNDLSDDHDGYDVNDEVCLSHKGWLAFSQWSAQKMMQEMGMESLEYWKEWDGVNGTCYPYDNLPAFGKAQEPTTKLRSTPQVPTNSAPAQPTINGTPQPITYFHHDCHKFQIDGNSLRCLDQQGQTVILVAPKKQRMADMLRDALGDKPEDPQIKERIEQSKVFSSSPPDITKMNPIEIGQTFHKLKRGGMTIPQMADHYRLTQREMRNHLKLRKLKPDEQEQVANGTLSLEDANKRIDRRDAGEETTEEKPASKMPTTKKQGTVK